MNKTEGFLVFNFENEKGFMQIFSERTVSLSCPRRLHSIRSIYFLLFFFFYLSHLNNCKSVFYRIEAFVSIFKGSSVKGTRVEGKLPTMWACTDNSVTVDVIKFLWNSGVDLCVKKPLDIRHFSRLPEETQERSNFSRGGELEHWHKCSLYKMS